MIRLVTFLVAVCLSYLSAAQGVSEKRNENTQKGANIEATVTNVLNKGGDIIFGLYDSVESFNSKQPTATKSVKAENENATVTFENIHPGTYAIVVLHDINGNKQMDFDEFGRPKEYYGASNNVMRMGPPSFEDAKFTVENKSVTLEIRF